MSDIADIKTALQTILASVDGINRTYAYPPRSVPVSDLPAAVVFTGPAQYDNQVLGRMNRLETRTFLVRVYVKPIAAGIDGEAEQAVEPFLRSVPAAFQNRLGLPGEDGKDLPFVQQATASSDQGVRVMEHNGDNFLGAEVRIEVETYVT